MTEGSGRKDTAAPKVGVVVLNWNGWEKTINCLSSVLAEGYPRLEAVLVDNGSKDGSLDKIQAWCDGKTSAGTRAMNTAATPRPRSVRVFAGEGPLEAGTAELTIVANDSNLGFAAGNNIGISLLLSDKEVEYILLLNNDIEMSPGCLRELLAAMARDTGAGACQPKMLSSTVPGQIDSVGISLSPRGGAMTRGYGDTDAGGDGTGAEVFGVCAGAAMYRREMLEDIGLFDEDFFFYFEDVDLSIRARAAGWKSICVSPAVVFHEHSAAYGKDSPLKRYYLERNGYYYMVKDMPACLAIRFVARKLLTLPWKAAALLFSGEAAVSRAVIRGNADGILKIPLFLEKRSRLRRSGAFREELIMEWVGK